MFEINFTIDGLLTIYIYIYRKIHSAEIYYKIKILDIYGNTKLVIYRENETESKNYYPHKRGGMILNF